MDPNNDIFHYSNYRLFLKDYYLSRKSSFPRFTYRLFAEKAGFSSASFQKLVIDGKKNLTEESILKISRALGLRRKAADYFESLVFFNQASTVEDKTHFLEKIDRFRKRNNPEKLLPREYDYLKEWYHCVIREMVEFPDFQESADYIRSKLCYTVKPETIEKSLNMLMETGFLIRDERGRLRKKTTTLATGEFKDDEISATVARQAHLTMIDLAKKAVSGLSKEERSVTNTTVSLSEESYVAAIKRIEQVRMELLELAATGRKADRVFQFSTVLFPLTKRDP